MYFKRKMPLICNTNQIKYTIVPFDDGEFNQIVDTADEYDNYEGIVGFISDGRFWNPKVTGRPIAEEIIKSYPGLFVVLEGPPNAIGSLVTNLIVLEHDRYYVTAYDTWSTPIGLVAVVTDAD